MNPEIPEYLRLANDRYRDAIDNAAEPAIIIAKLIDSIVLYRWVIKELGHEPYGGTQ